MASAQRSRLPRLPPPLHFEMAEGKKICVCNSGILSCGDERRTTVELIRPLWNRTSSFIANVAVETPDGTLLYYEKERINANPMNITRIVNRHVRDGLEQPSVRDSVPYKIARTLRLAHD